VPDGLRTCANSFIPPLAPRLWPLALKLPYSLRLKNIPAFNHQFFWNVFPNGSYSFRCHIPKNKIAFS
jgi:hypothetical protein